jgi:hypothetical protein
MPKHHPAGRLAMLRSGREDPSNHQYCLRVAGALDGRHGITRQRRRVLEDDPDVALARPVVAMVRSS